MVLTAVTLAMTGALVAGLIVVAGLVPVIQGVLCCKDASISKFLLPDWFLTLSGLLMIFTGVAFFKKYDPADVHCFWLVLLVSVCMGGASAVAYDVRKLGGVGASILTMVAALWLVPHSACANKPITDAIKEKQCVIPWVCMLLSFLSGIAGVVLFGYRKVCKCQQTFTEDSKWCRECGASRIRICNWCHKEDEHHGIVLVKDEQGDIVEEKIETDENVNSETVHKRRSRAESPAPH